MRSKQRRLIFGLIAAVLLAGAAETAGHMEPVRVMVLSSHDATPYRQAISGFERDLKQQFPDAAVDVLWLDAGAGSPASSVTAVRDQNPTMLFALGSRATQLARSEFPDRPMVASMILDGRELEGAANVASVVLSFSVETELQWLRRLLPAHRRIGILYDPELNSDRVARAQKAAATLDCEIVAMAVKSPREIPAALKALARRVDVLWGFPDSTVFSPETAKQILLFSFRNRIPLIGLSDRWVEAGALFALDPDYEDLGAQCAGLAVGMAQRRQRDKSSASVPRTVAYSVNLKTADRMKVEIPEDLLSGARRVFE